MKNIKYINIVIGIIFIYCGASLLLTSLFPRSISLVGLVFYGSMFLAGLSLLLWYLSSDRHNWRVIPFGIIFALWGLSSVASTVIAEFGYSNIWIWNTALLPAIICLSLWLTIYTDKKAPLHLPAILVTVLTFITSCCSIGFLLIFDPLTRFFVLPIVIVSIGLVIILAPSATDRGRDSRLTLIGESIENTIKSLVGKLERYLNRKNEIEEAEILSEQKKTGQS